MAFSTFVYFTSSDAGAPSLQNVNGSGITWMDWVLVTNGGWTKIFSSGSTIAVYQMPGGSGRVVRFVHDSATSGQNYLMTARGAESASGHSTLTNPFPLVAQEADTAACWNVATSPVGTLTRAYRGIVTEQFVLVFVQADGTNWIPHFFGDLYPVLGSDSNQTAIRVAVATTPTTHYGCGTYSSTSYTVASKWFANRTADGAVMSPRIFPVGNQSTLGTTGAGGLPNPEGISNRSLYWEVPIGDLYSQTTTGVSGSILSRRFIVPNLWQGQCSSYSGYTVLDTFQDSAYNPSATFELYAGGSLAANNGFLFLEQTNTWSPIVV